MEEEMDTSRAFEAEIPGLRRYARVLTRDIGAAEELLQECLARGLGKLHLWQEGTNLTAWLFTIMHNLHISERRRLAREGAAIELTEVQGKLAGPAAQDKVLELRDLKRALVKLAEKHRIPVILVGLGYEYQEVADVCGVPHGTIRSRLSRGRTLLKIAA
jgi:RNA polymerase sigma-70 factor, ECF subfamily